MKQVVGAGVVAGLLVAAAPAPAIAGAARLVVTAQKSGVQHVSLPAAVAVDPARVVVRGGARVVALYLAPLGGGTAHAGVLAARHDVRSAWPEPITLGAATALPRGRYRLTVVTDAPVEVSLPLRGSRTLRVHARGGSGASLAHWHGSLSPAHPQQVFRSSTTVTARHLVVVGVRHESRGAAVVATGACLTLSGSFCRVGGIRPVGSLRAPARDGTSEVAVVYEPGTVPAGRYDAVVESAQGGGVGTTDGFVVAATVLP